MPANKKLPSAVDAFEEKEFTAFGYALTRLYDQLDLDNWEQPSPEELSLLLDTVREIARAIQDKAAWATLAREKLGWKKPHPDVFLSDVADVLLERMADDRTLQLNPAQAVRTAEFALRLDDENVEALRIPGLVGEQAHDLAGALAAYQRAARTGWQSLSPEARRRYSQHKSWWGAIETRDYMRAEADVARLHWKLGQYSQAMRSYRKLLRLNPGDNQGNRYCLVCCALEAQDWGAARAVLTRHLRQEQTAVALYSQALLSYVQQGQTPAADAALQAALDENPHIPRMLQKGSDDLFDLDLPHYGHGDANEAVMYFQMAAKSWRQQPEALAWLWKAAKKAGLNWYGPRWFYPQDTSYRIEQLAAQAGRKLPGSRDYDYEKLESIAGSEKVQPLLDALRRRGVVSLGQAADAIEAFHLVEERAGYRFGYFVAGTEQGPVSVWGPRVPVLPFSQWEIVFQALQEHGFRIKDCLDTK